MTVAEKIVHLLEGLSDDAQEQVLDFVESLDEKTAGTAAQQENKDWEQASISLAMRGMEEEPAVYSTEDLKEVFS